MADMISADDARQILGCDDATLQNLVDNGTIRAQRVDGQLLLNGEDVQAQAGGGGKQGDSSDSILVLDSESEDLSIDLGEVVDDGAATMEAEGQTIDLESASGTDSLTFGDELEVVTFDDSQTEDLDLGEGGGDFDDEANTENLSFTDDNTAVITDVDETVVGTATATSDYQTVDFDDDEPGAGAPATASDRMAGSVRRSVRSQRARQQAPRIHPFFAICAILTALVAAGFIAPYYPIGLWPKQDKTYYNEDRAYGIDDTAWTNIASAIVGFSVEPDPDVFEELHPGEQHIPLSQWDPNQPDHWRYQEYRGQRYKDKDAGARAEGFIVDEVEMDVDGKPIKAKVTEGGTAIHTFDIKPADPSTVDADVEGDTSVDVIINYDPQ